MNKISKKNISLLMKKSKDRTYSIAGHTFALAGNGIEPMHERPEGQIKEFNEMHHRINSLNPTLVIDAGCGTNMHKPHIQNLIGFDPWPYESADLMCAILEAPFLPNSAEVVIAHGSIQYIDRQHVEENLVKVISWLKPGGLIDMRVDITKELGYKLKKYKFHWDYQLVDEFTEKYNLSFLIEPYIPSYYDKPKSRLRWVWTTS